MSLTKRRSFFTSASISRRCQGGKAFGFSEGELNLFQQGWLIFLDSEKVITVRINGLFANISLATHGVSNDRFSLQNKSFEQIKDSLRFIRFTINTRLTQHATGLMIECSEEMHCALMPILFDTIFAHCRIVV